MKDHYHIYINGKPQDCEVPGCKAKLIDLSGTDDQDAK